MSNHKPMILLAILVATSIFFIFFNATAVSKEIPTESMTDTLEPVHATTETSVVAYAKSLVIEQWGYHEWESFNNIIQHESGWKVDAANSTSSARGLCQTMTSLYDLPDDFLTNYKAQLSWCVQYTIDRYGTPDKAWSFWTTNRWW